ncbi:MAG: polyketide cyclase [Methylocystaceae bacterium]|jgi:Polyketide cyclase / dehydrase and lipid transport|nr:polyketide cyclase [Methylocystaceae bacterium]NBT96592.1 polyketide cyclase [Methylocystaceae bacterium]
MTLILLFMLAVLSGIIIFISLKSDKFHVARSVIVECGPEIVYPFINDFHKWRDWSPLATPSANASTEFDGSPLGAGAIYQWADDARLGAGKMKIIESSQNERVIIKRHIKKPLEVIDDISFNLTEAGAQTEIIWEVNRRLDFIGKAANLLKSLENRTGSDLEEGLKRLKIAVEKLA